MSGTVTVRRLVHDPKELVARDSMASGSSACRRLVHPLNGDAEDPVILEPGANPTRTRSRLSLKER